MKLTEKAAYIKGLADGSDYDRTSKEGKLIAALIDMVGEMADKIAELDATTVELNDYIEEIDQDLGDVEEYLYDEDEDEDDECDGDCENCAMADECEVADEDEDEDDEYFEIKCPSCGEVICFDESIDPEDLICPACHEKIACIVDEDDYNKVEKDEK